MLAYYGTELSPNQTETVEGYLICRNVPIARTGTQMYVAHELGLGGDPDRRITVHRNPEDVFEAAALASFEGKPVTDGHPAEDVGPENYAAYTKGHVQNVRREGELIVADLYINDAVLASQVRSGAKREVSCGYRCTYVPDGDGYRQTRIRGNHVAVVPRGRAGHEVAIKDAVRETEKGRHCMSEFWKSFLTAFGMAAKEASPEEVQAMAATTAATLDAEPAPAAVPPADQAPAGDGAAVQPEDGLGTKLDKLIEMVGALAAGTKPQEKQTDSPSLEDLVKLLSGGKEDSGKAVTIPAGDTADLCASPEAKDAALAIVRAMQPVVASIQDKTVQAQVTDGLLSAFRGPDVMGAITAAAHSSARKAADTAGKTSYEQRCADSEAAYAARNPHKRTEKEV